MTRCGHGEAAGILLDGTVWARKGWNGGGTAWGPTSLTPSRPR